MAVEDGAALAESLDMTTSASQIPHALRLWEAVRTERAGQMQEASLINGKLWHFADGPEQRGRDAATAAEVKGEPFEKSANQWSDPEAQRWTYGYDTTGIVRIAGQAMGLGRDKSIEERSGSSYINGSNDVNGQ